MEPTVHVDTRASEVYHLRVAYPHEDSATLSRRLGLPPEEIAAAETELAAIGLLRRSPSGGWVAVNPESAADEILAAAEEEILQRRIVMTTVRARLHTLSGHYVEARGMRAAKGDIEHVEGVGNVRALLEELARTSSRLDSLHTWLGEEAVRAALPLDTRYLGHGAAMRTVFQHSARNCPSTVRYAKALTDAGGEVKGVTALPTRMLVYDNVSAMLPMDPANTGCGAILVRDPAVLGLLTRLFDHVWGQATNFLAAEETAGPTPTGVEREVLVLISAGKTNDHIARQLGISPRTVTRVISDLMERLGADSRFQAGVKAARNGWLT